VVLSSGQHLLQLVNQLLDIASIDAGQSAFEVAPLTLATTLREAADLVRGVAGQREVALHAPAAGTASVQVLGNALRLRQVFVNLLGNAIKYNRPGGQVSVQVLAGDEAVEVQVVDTGCGMSPDQLQGLFEPFNRLGAQNSCTEGTGLGLVITQHLLSLMGGGIEACSQPGQGSTFTVQLRRVHPATPALPAPASAHGAHGAHGEHGAQGSDGTKGTHSTQATQATHGTHGNQPGEPPAHALAGKLEQPAGRQARGKVLYVEDNPVNAVLMEAIVGLRPQCTLRTARDGAQAMALLQQGDWLPALMLVDMHLPDTTGQALLQALRQQQPALRMVPAVMVSAAAGSDDVRAARAAGFSDYWVKPLDVDHTLAELDRWLALPQGHPEEAAPAPAPASAATAAADATAAAPAAGQPAPATRP
jgi:CheY-like chemotaxis protein